MKKNILSLLFAGLMIASCGSSQAAPRVIQEKDRAGSALVAAIPFMGYADEALLNEAHRLLTAGEEEKAQVYMNAYAELQKNPGIARELWTRLKLDATQNTKWFAAKTGALGIAAGVAADCYFNGGAYTTTALGTAKDYITSTRLYGRLADCFSWTSSSLTSSETIKALPAPPSDTIKAIVLKAQAEKDKITKIAEVALKFAGNKLTEAIKVCNEGPVLEGACEAAQEAALVAINEAKVIAKIAGTTAISAVEELATHLAELAQSETAKQAAALTAQTAAEVAETTSTFSDIVASNSTAPAAEFPVTDGQVESTETYDGMFSALLPW